MPASRSALRSAGASERQTPITVRNLPSIAHWPLTAGWSAVFRPKMKSRARVLVLFRTSVSAPDALRRPFFRRIGRRRPHPCRASTPRMLPRTCCRARELGAVPLLVCSRRLLAPKANFNILLSLLRTAHHHPSSAAGVYLRRSLFVVDSLFGDLPLRPGGASPKWAPRSPSSSTHRALFGPAFLACLRRVWFGRFESPPPPHRPPERALAPSPRCFSSTQSS